MAESTEESVQNTTDAAPTEPQVYTPKTPIKLRVRENTFETSVETLSHECPFFMAFFSSRWQHKHYPDGSIFFDWNSDLFDIFLQYQRSKSYPVLYDVTKGLNYVLYTRLLKFSDYLGLLKLTKWIRHKRYLDAVRISSNYSAQDDLAESSANIQSGPHQQWLMGKEYICPKKIPNHEGCVERCLGECVKNWQDFKYRDVVVLGRGRAWMKRYTFKHPPRCREEAAQSTYDVAAVTLENVETQYFDRRVTVLAGLRSENDKGV